MDTIIGRQIDHYQIEGILGEGGMGVVYKARDTKLDRIVALKMIRPQYAQDRTFMRRILIEARSLARINDPLIVTVYALRDEGEHVYIAMEYIDGFSLKELIEKRGLMPVDELIPIFIQLLKVLGRAHRAGIIHRDIKPANIMLTHDGGIRIMDFGLAHLHNSDLALTQTHEAGGTPYFMPPEQFKGLSFVDQRSDIYSLGMTLYNAVTGRLPMEEVSIFEIHRIVSSGDFPNPREFNADISEPLSRVIMKALAKNPEDRFQTAGEMEYALEDLNVDMAETVHERSWTPPATDHSTPENRHTFSDQPTLLDQSTLVNPAATVVDSGAGALSTSDQTPPIRKQTSSARWAALATVMILVSLLAVFSDQILTMFDQDAAEAQITELDEPNATPNVELETPVQSDPEIADNGIESSSNTNPDPDQGRTNALQGTSASNNNAGATDDQENESTSAGAEAQLITSGVVYMGNERIGSGTLTVAANTPLTVRCEHQGLSQEQTINLGPGTRQEIPCFVERNVNFNVLTENGPIGATIEINREPVTKLYQYPLSAGTHRLTVLKAGYLLRRAEVDDQALNATDGVIQLKLEPSFNDETVRIILHLEEM